MIDKQKRVIEDLKACLSEKSETIIRLQEALAEKEIKLETNIRKVVQLEKILADHNIPIPNEQALKLESTKSKESLLSNLSNSNCENLKSISATWRDENMRNYRNMTQNKLQKIDSITHPNLFQTLLQKGNICNSIFMGNFS